MPLYADNNSGVGRTTPASNRAGSTLWRANSSANPLATDSVAHRLVLQAPAATRGTRSSTFAQTSTIWGVIFARLLKLPNRHITLVSSAGRGATIGA